MTKIVKLPKESIYIVVSTIPYEGYHVISAFKTKQLADDFVKEIKDLFKKNKKTVVKFGDSEIDHYDAEDIEVLENSLYINGPEVPFFQ